MELYYVSLHAIEEYAKEYFDGAGPHGTATSPEPASEHAPEQAPARPSRATRLRLWLSAGLYELAEALDPAPELSPKPQP